MPNKTPKEAAGEFTPVATVKAEIKKKFRNVRRFADIAQFTNPDMVHNIFKKGPGPDLELIYTRVKELQNMELPGEVTTEDRKKLQTFINDKYAGNVAEFVRKNGVDYPTTYKILNAGITAKTELVNNVLKLAE